MGFSESIKLEVKRKAAFQCCRCKEIGVEVHHIIPESETGSDTIDNAAPLCPTCHSNFGGNPEKRKEIKHMRDYWYDVVRERYSKNSEQLEKFEKIDKKLDEIQNDHRNTADKVEELKNLLSQLTQKSRISADNTPAEIRSISTGFISATTLGEGVHANFRCRKCNTQIGLLVGSNSCPTCGEQIR